MTQISKEDNLALRKFGLVVPESQKQELLKQIRSTPAIKQEFEKIKQSISTMLDETLFLDTIMQSHQKISQIPENLKVIQVRDGTFVIRAINPEQIESLTQRAFFNSFSLERIMLKDIESEEIKKEAEQKQQNSKKQQPQQPNPHSENLNETQKCICICGKNKDKQTPWIQCANEQKCRGSSWYHLECSGLVNVNLQDLESLNYICMYCKRGADESNLSSDGTKRVKRN